jgi:hypothetical protein
VGGVLGPGMLYICSPAAIVVAGIAIFHGDSRTRAGIAIALAILSLGLSILLQRNACSL